MGSSEELRLMYPRGGIEAGWVGGWGWRGMLGAVIWPWRLWFCL